MKRCWKKVKLFSIEEIGTCFLKFNCLMFCCCCFVSCGGLGLVLWGLFCEILLVCWLRRRGGWGGGFLGFMLVLLFFFCTTVYMFFCSFFTITSWKLETGFSFKWHLVLSSWVTLGGFFFASFYCFFFLYFKKNHFLSSGHKPTHSLPVSWMMQLYAINMDPKQVFLGKLASVENKNDAALQQLGTNIIDPCINYGYCLFAFHFLGNNIMINTD